MLSTFVSVSLLLTIAAFLGLALAREARAMGGKMRPQPVRIEQDSVRRRRC